MKKSIYIALLAGAPLLMGSCSSDEAVEGLDEVKEVVSEDIVEELNEVQELNQETHELENEVDEFLETL